jgi:hypothetical protein
MHDYPEFWRLRGGSDKIVFNPRARFFARPGMIYRNQGAQNALMKFP